MECPLWKANSTTEHEFNSYAQKVQLWYFIIDNINGSHWFLWGLLWKWCGKNGTSEGLPNISPHFAIYIQVLIRQQGKSRCNFLNCDLESSHTLFSEVPSSPTKLFPFENEIFILFIKETCAPFSNYSLQLNQFHIRWKPILSSEWQHKCSWNWWFLLVNHVLEQSCPRTELTDCFHLSEGKARRRHTPMKVNTQRRRYKQRRNQCAFSTTLGNCFILSFLHAKYFTGILAFNATTP